MDLNSDLMKELNIKEDDPRKLIRKLQRQVSDYNDKIVICESNDDKEEADRLRELNSRIKAEINRIKNSVQDIQSEKTDSSGIVNVVSDDSKKIDNDDKINIGVKAKEHGKKDFVKLSSSSLANFFTKNTGQNQENNKAKNESEQALTVKQRANMVLKIISGFEPLTVEFSDAVNTFKQEDYGQALIEFRNIANSVSGKNINEEKARGYSSYLVSLMYKYSIGTKNDMKAYEIYLNYSAESGYNRAQLEYGDYFLRKTEGNKYHYKALRGKCIDYIEQSANSGNVSAMIRYIELAQVHLESDEKMISKARAYIKQIEENYGLYKKEFPDLSHNILKKHNKEIKKLGFRYKRQLIGKILVFVGMLYFFKGLNSIFFNETVPVLSYIIPDIPESLILKWNWLKSLIEPYMTLQGLFGCWLMTTGITVKFLAYIGISTDSKVYKISRILTVITVLIYVFHFAANILEGSGFFGNGGILQFLALPVIIIISIIIGFIIMFLSAFVGIYD